MVSILPRASWFWGEIRKGLKLSLWAALQHNETLKLTNIPYHIVVWIIGVSSKSLQINFTHCNILYFLSSTHTITVKYFFMKMNWIRSTFLRNKKQKSFSLSSVKFLPCESDALKINTFGCHHEVFWIVSKTNHEILISLNQSLFQTSLYPVWSSFSLGSISS